MEYKILTRINCHKQKYDSLYHSYHGDFKSLNKYPDILTFANNRVVLGKPKDAIVFNVNTQQAELSNMSQESLSEDEERNMSSFKMIGLRNKITLARSNSNRMIDEVSSSHEQSVTDYVNACYVNSCLDQNTLIAAMAPTVRAIPMFWQMVFENNVGLIMMLCEFKVNAKQQCEYYFGKPKKLK